MRVPLLVPRFDKAIDDRVHRAQWRKVESRVDIILFVGRWVGATPQSEAGLIEPVNDLERLETQSVRGAVMSTAPWAPVTNGSLN